MLLKFHFVRSYSWELINFSVFWAHNLNRLAQSLLNVKHSDDDNDVVEAQVENTTEL